MESPRGVEQAARSAQLLLVQAPTAVGLQLIYWEVLGWGRRVGGLVGGEGWQVLRPRPMQAKLMGHLGEEDRAGPTALSPRLPWNAMFIYGSLFLWGNDFGLGWGSWQNISKEICLLPLSPLTSPAP